MSDYGTCRCERQLVCRDCLRAPEDCDCSNVFDDLAAQAEEDFGECIDHLDPLTRVLLGFPSGIRCRNCHGGAA